MDAAFSWGIFSHVTRLDQSRASENSRRIIKHDLSANETDNIQELNSA